MTEAEFGLYWPEQVASYARSKITSGAWTAQDAQDKSRAHHDILLPEGLGTAGHHLFIARDADSGERVGDLWFVVRDDEAGMPEAFVYKVAVAEELRGRGYGKAVMRACAEAARELGAAQVRLHVFGHNETARRLYGGLGFRETNVWMALEL